MARRRRDEDGGTTAASASESIVSRTPGPRRPGLAASRRRGTRRSKRELPRAKPLRPVGTMDRMRIALVSPYSWTYPGGVTRHIEALAGEFLGAGHEVRVLAPFDPNDRLAARLHRGARPEPREVPDYLIPLGRTIGLPANGAVSNLSFTPYGLVTMRRALEQGGFDVVHIHEPVAPVPSWDATLSARTAARVGTFHCFSENPIANNLASLIGARRT